MEISRYKKPNQALRRHRWWPMATASTFPGTIKHSPRSQTQRWCTVSPPNPKTLSTPALLLPLLSEVLEQSTHVHFSSSLHCRFRGPALSWTPEVEGAWRELGIHRGPGVAGHSLERGCGQGKDPRRPPELAVELQPHPECLGAMSWGPWPACPP